MSGAASGPAARPRERDRAQLLAELEKHYAHELGRMSPQWLCSGDGPHQPPIDVASEVGVPGVVLGAILAGKCRDQHIVLNLDRQRRFAEWMHTHCSSLWFNLNDNSAGPECAKGVCLALALNERFTSLNLSNNALGDVGAATVAHALPDHQTLVHIDLAANDISHHGMNAIFEALLVNRSVTSLDLSSKSGSLRNHMSKYNAFGLEKLMIQNPVLARLCLQGTNLGADGVLGLARGLVVNSTLVFLDLAGCDLGPRGAAAVAEALLPSGIEELNMSDNKMGDEGLMAIADALGAPPMDPGALPVGTLPPPALMLEAKERDTRHQTTAKDASDAAAAKYRENLHVARSSILELNPLVLANQQSALREEAFATIKAHFERVHATIDRTVRVPKVRVLNLSNNGGSVLGVGRIEDALQVNDRLERLVLDQCDHRGSVKSLVGALPLNRGLKHLSLSSCRIGQAGTVELAKVLPLSSSLESLCLRGNEFSATAAAALGGVLSLGSQSLRSLNLSSCRLSDEAGIAIASGLFSNTTLEVLQLRDNTLREGSGRALVESLRKHTILVTVNLELNSIDFRFLTQISQFLERNARLRERSKPEQYRRRIGELEACQRKVDVLGETLKQNDVRKDQTRKQQASVQQELRGAKVEERRKGEALEAHLDSVRRSFAEVDGEVSVLEEALRKVTGEGEYEVSQLRHRIHKVDDRIKLQEKRVDQTSSKLQAFEDKAGKELSLAKEELEKADKARSSASLLTQAAQRNLDSYTSSLKSIEDGISGAASPRRRFQEQSKQEARPPARRPQSGGAAGGRGAKSPGRPKSAKAASPSTPQPALADVSAAGGDAAAVPFDACAAALETAATAAAALLKPKSERPRSRGFGAAKTKKAASAKR